MLPSDRIAAIHHHQDPLASAAPLPSELAPFSPHLYEIWVTGVRKL